MPNRHYLVRSGDTLSAIARRYNVAVDVLARLNAISDVNRIWVGQSLEIPAENPRLPRSTPPPVMHRVRAGETLSAIALRYRVSVDALAQANGISDPNRITIGQSLRIPRATPPSTSEKTPSTSRSAPPLVRSSRSPILERPTGGRGPGKLRADQSTLIADIGRVSNAQGVNLRARPEPSAAIKKKLPFNTRLFVGRELPGNWFFVTLADGTFGYAYSKYITLHPPEPAASLHWIKPGESALQIVKQYYKGDAIKWGQDERYYVNVLVEANRHKNPSGIYKPSATADWSQTRTRQGYLIWIPSVAFANSLKGKVSSGSITYELWQAAKNVAQTTADIVMGAAAFVAGLLHGALESVWDLLVGIIDLVKLAFSVIEGLIKGLISAVKFIWDAVASLDIKEVLENLKQLPQLLRELPETARELSKSAEAFFAHLADAIAALFKAGLNAFLARWNAPDLLRRWHFRGWIIGYVIAEIALLLLDGIVILKWLGKSAKLAKVLEKFPSIVKLLEKAGEAWKTLSEATRKRIQKALSLGKKKRLLEYEKLAERIRKVYSAADFEKVLAHAEKLAFKEKELRDFLEMGIIAKPWKKPPKVPLTVEELMAQMETWTKVIKPRGYPFLFSTLEEFNQFRAKLMKLLKKYNLPKGRVVIQGSALRSPLAKDLDIAIFVSDKVFAKYLAACKKGIVALGDDTPWVTKNLKALAKHAEDGFIRKGQFTRYDPAVTFEAELWELINSTIKKKVDISVMKESSKMNLSPFLEL
jgi:LysM repeat protein